MLEQMVWLIDCICSSLEMAVFKGLARRKAVIERECVMRRLSLFRLFCLLLGLGLVLSSFSAFAQEKKDKLPRSGNLASTLTRGGEDVAVDGPWGDNDISGREPPPISGSISRIAQRTWLMKVFNNTKDRYSVDLEVVQFNQRGTRLRGDYFSYTLDGGQSIERKVMASSNVTECQVNLRNWRKYEAPKKVEAGEVAEEEASGKVEE